MRLPPPWPRRRGPPAPAQVAPPTNPPPRTDAPDAASTVREPRSPAALPTATIVAEVVTHKVRDTRKKMALLIETVAFAREHLKQDHSVREPLPVPAGATGRDARRARRDERRS